MSFGRSVGADQPINERSVLVDSSDDSAYPLTIPGCRHSVSPRGSRQADQVDSRPFVLSEPRTEARRAYRFMQASADMITSMDSEMVAAPGTSRVGVMMRLSMPLRDGLQRRLTESAPVTMNGYLEALVLRDIASSDLSFEVFRAPTTPARGVMGRGRPTTGPRSLILLRVESAVRELIHQRAEALGLRLNVYLESLVSQDISAAPAPKEAVVLDQSA